MASLSSDTSDRGGTRGYAVQQSGGTVRVERQSVFRQSPVRNPPHRRLAMDAVQRLRQAGRLRQGRTRGSRCPRRRSGRRHLRQSDRVGRRGLRDLRIGRSVGADVRGSALEGVAVHPRRFGSEGRHRRRRWNPSTARRSSRFAAGFDPDRGHQRGSRRGFYHVGRVPRSRCRRAGRHGAPVIGGSGVPHLYLRDNRPAEGCDAVPRQHHQQRQRVPRHVRHRLGRPHRIVPAVGPLVWADG